MRRIFVAFAISLPLISYSLPGYSLTLDPTYLQQNAGGDSIPSFVKSPVATLWDSPKSDHIKIMNLSQYTKIIILECLENNYCKISYAGKTGYINSKDINLPSKQSPEKASHSSIPNYLNSPAAPSQEPKRVYFLGDRGGCYYINSHGNKVYVDRSLCD